MATQCPFGIDADFLAQLSQQARLSERKRMHYDLRDSADDNSMRMLNALEPETVIPIHRHTQTSEDVVVLRGCVEEVLFDDHGQETQRVRLTAGGPCMACHVPLGQYHTCRSLQSGSVIIEFKNTRYDPHQSEELLPLP